MEANLKIEIRDLTMAFGSSVLMRDLNAHVRRGQIFAVIGDSGCGKSTLLRHMIGLKQPAKGDIHYDGTPYWQAAEVVRQRKRRSLGVVFQCGNLCNSMTLAENAGRNLGASTGLPPAEIREIATRKLALVGLAGYEDYFPAELPAGMCQRAGLARALAPDPEVLFFDEPSAGLDPATARDLDKLILQLRDRLGVTIVVMTHGSAGTVKIADNFIILDPIIRTMRAGGSPRGLPKRPARPAMQTSLTAMPEPIPRFKPPEFVNCYYDDSGPRLMGRQTYRQCL